MASNEGTISVKLVADTKKLTAGLKAAKGHLSDFGESAKTAGLKAGLAFGAVGLALKKTYDAAKVQIQAETKLAAAIRASGKAIDANKLKAFASARQEVTTFGDEATIAMMGTLATFQLTEDQILGLTSGIQDFAAISERDLNSVAIVIGRLAASGQADLAEYGIVLSETEREAFKNATTSERVAMTMALLAKKAGGAAKALALTDFGRIEQATMAFGDALEEVGKVIASMLAPAADVVTSLALGFSKLSVTTKKWIVGLGGIATAALGIVSAAAAFGAMKGSVIAVVVAMGTLAKAAWAALAPMLPMIGAVALMVTGVAAAVGAGVQAWRFYKDEAIAAWQSIKETTSTAFDWIGSLARDAAKLVSQAVVFIVQSIKGEIGGLFARLGTGFKRLMEGKFIGTLDAMSEAHEKYSAGVRDETVQLFAEIDKSSAGLLSDADVTFKKIGGAIADGISSGADSAKDALKWLGKFAKEQGGILASSLGTTLELLGIGGGVAAPTGEGKPAEGKPPQIKTGKKAGKKPAAGGKKPNTVGEVFATGILERVVKAFDPLVSLITPAIAPIGKAVGGAVIDGLGAVGNIIEATVVGGPMGGLIATITEVINASEPLNRIFGEITSIFQRIVAAFDPLFEALTPVAHLISIIVDTALRPLAPVFKAMGDVLRPILAALVPIVQLYLAMTVQLKLVTSALTWLQPAFEMFAELVEVVGKGLFEMANKVIDIWNGIVDAIAGILESLGGLKFSVFGHDIKPFGMLEDAADSFRNAAEISKMTWEDLNRPLSEAGENFEKLNESMTNIPTGLKVALRRFQATDGQQFAPVGGGQGAGSQSTQTVSINNVNISAEADVDRVVGRVLDYIHGLVTADAGPMPGSASSGGGGGGGASTGGGAATGGATPAVGTDYGSTYIGTGGWGSAAFFGKK